MTFEIEINDRSRTVSVERTASGRFRVIVDGRPHDVDAVRAGAFGLSLLLTGDAGISREIQIAPAGGGASGLLLVGIDGRTVAATVNARRTRRAGAHGSADTHGEQAIVAPMPGRVVRVLVAPGDAVAARQGVVVVEAMKMENELRSPKAGRVKDVAVTPGTSVEAGRVLVVIE
jgi:acetyl/propionyl-CoA carboxylase alpha subunit